MADKQSKDEVQWGTIIAGSAAVAGAVVLMPTLLPDLADGLGDIGTEIGKAVSSMLSSTAAPTISAETARNIAGSALLGGGTAYLLTHGKKSDGGFEDIAEAQDEAGFAMKEDVKRMQAVMRARMMAASPQHMQQMGGAGVQH